MSQNFGTASRQLVWIMHDEQNWQDIWRSRGIDGRAKPTLKTLMALDGFDTLGKMDEAAWMEYIRLVQAKLRIRPGDSIFEVGCGAGAFLFPFYRQGHPVGGIDYAENLVGIARRAMPGAALDVCRAIDLDPAEKFDFVAANGVFLYFRNEAYAGTVLDKMASKAVKGIALLDIPDKTKIDYAMKLRRGALGEAEYQRRYKGLPHLYFRKKWFEMRLAARQMEVCTEDQTIHGYLHSSYRFNVFGLCRRCVEVPRESKQGCGS